MYIRTSSGAVPLSRHEFSNGIAPTLVNNVNCIGNESHLLDCNYNDLPNFCENADVDAGVVCQGM